MRSPVRRALLVAVVALVAMAPFAAADDDGWGDDDEGSEALGTTAGVFLAGTGILVPANALKKKVLVPRLRGNPDALRMVAFASRRVLMPAHTATGVLAFVAGLAHGLTAGDANAILWAGMAVMGLLLAGGAVLRWKRAPGSVRRGAYLLHAQQALFLALLALLFVGHLFVDD